MKIACLMCAVWTCSPLAFQTAVAAAGPLERAPAAQSLGDRGAAERGPAARGPAESSRALPAERASSQGLARVSPAQPGTNPLARSNADRLHSLLRAQARPAAKPLSRPVPGSSRVETIGTALGRTRGLQGASPASLSRTASPKIPGRALRGSNVPMPGAAVPAPHPDDPGRLGGPGMGRAASGRAAIGGAAFGRTATANRGMLDGAQVRRRF